MSSNTATEMSGRLAWSAAIESALVTEAVIEEGGEGGQDVKYGLVVVVETVEVCE